MNSIIGNKKARSVVEQTAEIIFTICAFFAVLAVISITVYMFLMVLPPLQRWDLQRSCSAQYGSQPLQIPVTAFYTSF